MNEETKLPEGLQVVVDILEEVRARFLLALRPKAEAIAAGAIEAIRTEHAQRLTLEQRVADLEADVKRLSPSDDEMRYTAAQDWSGLSGAVAWHLADRHGEGWAGIGDMMEAWRDAEAQRVTAGLIAERDNTAAHVASIALQLGDESLQVDDIAVRVLGLIAERDRLQQARRDAQELAERYQAERNQAGVQARREAAEHVRKLTAERDMWRNDAAKLLAHSEAQIETAQASLQERLMLDRSNRLLTAERDGLKHQHHAVRADAQARVDAAVIRALAAEKERDELRARLAEIEAQEPAMYVLRSASRRPQPSVVTHQRYLSVAISDRVDVGIDHLDPLYARPVPAIPAGWKLVPVEPTPEPAIVEAGELRIGFGDTEEAVWLKLSQNIPLGTKLYACPVPAQAVPDGWRLVKAGALQMVVNALRRDAEDGRPVRGEMADELLNAAPEHKA